MGPDAGWLEWGVIIVAAVLVAVLVRAFVFQTFFIPSTSMYPTLQPGDRIVVLKLETTPVARARSWCSSARRPRTAAGRPCPTW